MKKLRDYFCPLLEITYLDLKDIILVSQGNGDNFVGDDVFDVD